MFAVEVTCRDTHIRYLNECKHVAAPESGCTSATVACGKQSSELVYKVCIHNAGTPICEICLSMSIINNADETRCADPNGPANPSDTFSDEVLKRKFLRYVHTIQVHWNTTRVHVLAFTDMVNVSSMKRTLKYVMMF